MRHSFIKRLIELAKEDENIYLLSSDTGYTILEEFIKLFPERYLNIGISESNMIGVAAGLAMSGKTVFAYAIVPFITMRCFEQIRVDLCYQNLPVKLVGIGGGLTYGPAGPTHHSIEDIGIMSCLPNMTIINPGDPFEVKKAVEASLNLKGPCYFRLGKSGEPVIHNESKCFEIGKGIKVLEGKDISIIVTGNMLETGLKVSQMLQDQEINPELISMHTIKPIDKDLILESAKKCKFMVTIEEHNIIGGLGSQVSGILTDNNLHVRIKRFAIPDEYVEIAGSQDYLRNIYGLTAEQIFNSIKDLLKNYE
ncbi:MAG: transketolase C-terminal domain-containing protein [Candidatus Gastranaerophilales bacterium]|nr:transketolase C-terminal domain-containing protein [Candidatus Gastranaerophilales bacterium]